jgi:hypothetical protein
MSENKPIAVQPVRDSASTDKSDTKVAQRQIVASEQVDHFLAYKIYPDASTLFNTGTPNFQAVKDSCHVVLDTNALLLPYNTGATSLESIRKVFAQLIERAALTVPGHVAREFVKNRPDKIKNIYSSLTDRRNKLIQLDVQKVRFPLLESLPEYQRLKEAEESINAQVAKLREEHHQAIGKIQDLVEGWNWNDPVSQVYSELFTGAVVRDLALPPDELLKNFEWRNKNRIPPGFQDHAKLNADGQPSENIIGDLVIWHTILEIGREKKTSLLFVSGDIKNDWRIQSSGKALYPRFELVDEYRRESGGFDFHMASLSELLAAFETPDEVVRELENEERVQLITHEDDTFGDAFGLAVRYIRQNYRLDEDRSLQSSDFDFIGKVGGYTVAIHVDHLTHGDALSVGELVNEHLEDVDLSQIKEWGVDTIQFLIFVPLVLRNIRFELPKVRKTGLTVRVTICSVEKSPRKMIFLQNMVFETDVQINDPPPVAP